MPQDTVETAQREQQKPKGLIGNLLSLPWRIFGLLLASLLLSLLFEYIGLAFFWQEEGWKHSQTMFSTELSWLSENFRQSLLVSDPGQTIGWLMNQAYEWLFVKSGFMAFSQSAHVNANGKGILAWASGIYVLIEDYVLASVYVTMTFLVRVSILVLSIPLFILAFLTGAVDGLMRRDLRRFGAGRESSFVYHRAKRLIVPLLVAPWIIYLSIPITVYPQLVLIPCAISLGIAVAVTAATFKKYL